MAAAGRRRRILIGGVCAVGVLVGVGALLGIEVSVAGNGPHLVEFDPHLADGVVGTAAAGERPLRVVWLGDSTAAGVGASSADNAVSRQVARRMGRPVDLRVLAISGARIADVRADQIDKVGTDVDLILLSIGANDVTHLTAANNYERDFEAVIAALPPAASVVLLGVPDLGSPTRLPQPLRWIAGRRGQGYDAMTREMAQEHGAAYVNIARETGATFRSDPDRYLAADHYHPSDAGYGLWTDAIVPVVSWKLFIREHPNDPVPPVPRESAA